MYTPHKSIIAFLLFFITRILAQTCAPPERESLLPLGTIVDIRDVKFTGPRCNSATVNYNAPESRIEVDFNFPYANAGPNIPPDENTFECFVSFTVDYPDGWAPSVWWISYGSFFNLDANVKSFDESNYHFGPGPEDITLSRENYGPASGSYCLGGDVFTEVNSCVPSETPFGIRTTLRIDNSANPNGFGFIQQTSVHYIGLQWHLC
ncbi:hypothetical protein BDZ91DRAFT_808065 [Kalaharituber pfeilii]|nr:hypothetical protein BDZ91DRAFT_808065 [Kalaharituber pfeilii]